MNISPWREPWSNADWQGGSQIFVSPFLGKPCLTVFENASGWVFENRMLCSGWKKSEEMGVLGKGNGGRGHHWSGDLKVFAEAPVEGVGEGRREEPGAGGEAGESREQGRVTVLWATEGCYGVIRPEWLRQVSLSQPHYGKIDMNKVHRIKAHSSVSSKDCL